VSEAVQALRDRLIVSAFRAGDRAAQYAPHIVGRSVASGLGVAAAVATPARRLIVQRNLERALGRPLSSAERVRLIAKTFDSYAHYYYDSFRLPHLSVEEVRAGFTVEGIEHLDAAMAEDAVGPVLALPHLGGWEWAAAWITGVKGWGLCAVAEELEPKELSDWFLGMRRALGMNIVTLGPAAGSQVAVAAANKEVICLLSDRDIGGSGVPVTFFGEETTLPVGPALLALRGGSRIMPTAVFFRDGGIHGVVRPPLDVSRQGSLREDIGRVTQNLAHELEALIRMAPEQWHLMSPNWPSDDAALAAAGLD
jgi:KDO2-lipid IV(A) lauroyltransferase